MDLPGVPDMMEQDDETEVQSSGGEQFPEDEDPYEKTYIAIDGLDPEDLTDEQIDAIEKSIADTFLLEFQFPITGVRVVAGDSYVIEYDSND
jgi:hypothetical protein